MANSDADEDGGGWPKPQDGPQGRLDQPPTGRSRSTAAALWIVLLVGVLLVAGYAVFTWALSRPVGGAADGGAVDRGSLVVQAHAASAEIRSRGAWRACES